MNCYGLKRKLHLPIIQSGSAIIQQALLLALARRVMEYATYSREYYRYFLIKCYLDGYIFRIDS